MPGLWLERVLSTFRTNSITVHTNDKRGELKTPHQWPVLHNFSKTRSNTLARWHSYYHGLQSDHRWCMIHPARSAPQITWKKSATMSQSAECGAMVVPQWSTSLRKHDTVCVTARMRMWLDTQWKRVADKLDVTWRTVLKGLDIRSSRLWRRSEGTKWIGPLSQPCTSSRTCNELGDVCSLPSCCKGPEKPSHDAMCSL
jgi:hypothetical protein